MSELNLDAPEVKKLVEDAVAAADQKAEARMKDTVDKNTAHLNEIRTLKIKLKDYNPEAIAELEKRVKEIDDQKHQKNIEGNDMEAVVKKYEDRINEILAAKELEVNRATTKSEQLQSSYTNSITQNTALEALAKRNVRPEVMLNNILPFIETKFDENGKFNTIINDVAGNQRFDPNTNLPLNADNLLDEMSLLPAFAPNFPQAGGGGAPKGDSSSNIGGVTKYSDLKTFEDKKAYRDKHGQEAVDALINAGQ